MSSVRAAGTPAASSTSFAKLFDPSIRAASALGPKVGTPVSYPELQGYVMYTEASMFFFGLALLFEAAMLWVIHSPRAKFKRLMIMLALLVAFTATALNLIVALMLLTTGILPLLPLLAVAFGGYIVMHEWRLLQDLNARESAAAHASTRA